MQKVCQHSVNISKFYISSDIARRMNQIYKRVIEPDTKEVVAWRDKVNLYLLIS